MNVIPKLLINCPKSLPAECNSNSTKPCLSWHLFSFQSKRPLSNSLDYKVLNWNGMGWYLESSDVIEALLGLLPNFG